MRWLARILLAVVLILLVGLPTAWLTRNAWVPQAARWGLNTWAAQRGAEGPVVTQLAFRIGSVGPERAELTGVEVNGPGGFAADRVVAAYDWRDLLDGRIRSVAADRPSLTVTVDADGAVSFGRLEPLRALAGDGGDDHPPPVVRFSDAEILIDGAAQGRVVAGGTVGESDGALGLAADGSAVVEAQDWRGEGQGSLLVSVGDARTRINATLTGARVRRGDLSTDGLRGTASVEIADSGEIEAIADLRADRAEASGVAVAVPSAHLRLDPLGLSAVFRLGDRDAPDLRLALSADGPEGDRRPVGVDLAADLATLDRLAAAARRVPPRGLTGRLDGTLRGTMPAELTDPGRIWDGTVAAGELTLQADAPQGTARARFGAAIAAGTLALETLEPAQVAVGADLFPSEAAEVFGGGPVTARLGRPDKSFRLAISGLQENTALALGGPISAQTEAGAELTWDGDAEIVGDLAAPGIRSASGTLNLRDLSMANGHLWTATLALEELSGDAGKLAGSGTLTALGDAGDVQGIQASLPLRLAYDANGTAVFLSGRGRVTVPQMPSAGGASVEGPLTVDLLSSRRPFLRRGFDDPEALRLDLPVSLASARGAIDGGMPLRVALASAAGRLKARMVGARGGAVLRLSTERIEVAPSAEDPDSPDGIALVGVALEAVATTHGDSVALDRVALSAHEMTDRARNARFAPLRVEGEAVRLDSGALEFTSTFRGADGAFVLDAKGFHDVAEGKGRAYINLFPLVFVPGGLQPVTLSPAAAATLRNASGRVSVKGAVEWPGTDVPPDEPLTLTVEDLAFTGSLGTVSGLSGSVALSSIDPLTTLAGQTLTATGIDVGVPIAEPSVAFHLDPDLTLVLETVRARFADGIVHTKDVTFPLRSGEPISMVLDVDGVDAARLAEVTDLEGLTATGSLTGRLPLVWDFEEGLSLRRARLSAATAGGTVQYRPANPPPALQDSGEEVSLLMQAVRNLVYEQFEIEADGRPGEPFDIKLRVRGANPDLFDGYPVALNVTLSGRLDEMFLNARRTLGLSDVLRRKLEAHNAGG